jgi:hypothetical protein
MSDMAAAIRSIEKQLDSERADIGKGLPMFARGRLNGVGDENSMFSPGGSIYGDTNSSAGLTLSPTLGQIGISCVGPAISLMPTFNGVTYDCSHRNWEWISPKTDTSARRKGWGRGFFAGRNGCLVYNEELGAEGRIRFVGTGFVLYAQAAPTRGKIAIYVDEVLITTFNTYNVGYVQVTYTAVAGTFTNSEHILRLVNVSDGAEAGTNFQIMVTVLEILPTVGPTYTNGNPVVTNISDTSQLCVGWSVTSARAGAARTIVSIDSDTQITMSGNATSTGDAATTFAPPADINYDMFLDGDNLRPYVWATHAAGTSTRQLSGELAWYGGYLSRINYPSWRYVGTFRTHAAGYTRYYSASRLIWNMYNRTHVNLKSYIVNSHTYTTPAYRMFAGVSIVGQTIIEVLCGLPAWGLIGGYTASYAVDAIGEYCIVVESLNAVGTLINTTRGFAAALNATTAMSGHMASTWVVGCPVGYNQLLSVEYGNNPSGNYNEFENSATMEM